jgi:protein-L-isoaspartate(D-aspartate) O-methyltransferase
MRDTGIGMTSQRTRMRMVERLRAQGIRDETVLAAMGEVPRHIFVDEALASRAYEDIALPLGYGQTISSPHTVARMTELARNGRMLGKVLEVGTGCGYQTAVLGRVAKQVYSMERLAALIRRRAGICARRVCATSICATATDMLACPRLRRSTPSC